MVGQRTLDRRRRNSVLLSVLFVLGLPCAIRGQSPTVRVDVTKKSIMTGTPPILLYPPISSESISRQGFTLLADYGSHTLYEGPSGSVVALIQGLGRDDYDARVASDLDEVRYQDFTIDPETGAISPPAATDAPPPSDPEGLFILVLKGYPLESWLNALAAANVRILQELPPAAYLVRGDRALLARLKDSRPFVRGVFPLLPAMKKVLFGPSGSESPFRQVSIEAVDEKPSDSLSAHLSAVSDKPVSSSRSGRRVRYSASITDLDAEVLTYFENVYSVAAVGEVGLSSERQGVILFQQGTPLTLPDQCPNYSALLVNGGVENFSNTRIGIIDTGFNDGTNAHPDFPEVGDPPTPVIELPIDRGLGASSADRDLHGTLVTSVVTGFVPFGQRADSQGYRYTLGLAPTARVVLDKMLECRFRSSLTSSLERMANRNVDIVNLSFNTELEAGCSYGPMSREADDRARSMNWLFTISAGNVYTQEGGTCRYVRDPGTAKNGITAGATMGFTPLELGWPDVFPPLAACNPDLNNCDTCNWSRLNAGVPNAYSDARNIPSFSARRNPTALIKPDLVAPATHVTGPVGVLPPPPPADPQHRCASIFCHEDVDDFGIVRYGYSAGTSFAAPAVAGAAAVVRSWHLKANGHNPSPAMTKAMLINGARDIGGSSTGAYVLAPDTLTPIGDRIGNIPNEYQGWGMLSLARLLDPNRLNVRGNFFFYDQRSALMPGSVVWQKYLYVVDGTRDTRITVVWTDPPSETSSEQKYVAINNLNLSAVAAGGSQRWYGNILSGGYSVLNPSFPLPDKLNNVEQVIIPAGLLASGTGFLVAVDPFAVLSNQDFALFVDNATEPATSLQTVTPCRAVNTLDPDGPYGGPAIAANSVRTFPMANRCGIPVSARAIALNVTVIGPEAIGSLSLYPGGIATPTAEAIYYSAGQIRGNNGVVAVAPGGDLAVRANQPSGSVNVVIDVTGYF